VGSTDNTPPSFAFNFIPITAGGIAFMYNVPGLTTQLKLTSRTACALLTGGITNWDDPNLAAANPGVTLPNLPVVPVTESDAEGTNYVLEEWCIDETVGGLRERRGAPAGRTDRRGGPERDRSRIELARH
jgi:ABC-type phosphate transport system substrate-binding protein